MSQENKKFIFELTDEEIEYISSILHPYYIGKSAEYSFSEILKNTRIQLKNLHILSDVDIAEEDRKALIDKASVILKKQWNISKISDGDNIGIIAAQSIGQPTTQMTLNMFHSSGIGTANSSLGFAFFEKCTKAIAPDEIFCKLYFDKNHPAKYINGKNIENGKNGDELKYHTYMLARRCAKNLLETSFKDIVDSYEIIYNSEENIKHYSTWLKYKKKTTKKYTNCYIITFKLLYLKMFERGLSIINVIDSLNENIKATDVDFIPYVVENGIKSPPLEVYIDAMVDTRSISIQGFDKEIELYAKLAKKCGKKNAPSTSIQKLYYYHYKIFMLTYVLNVHISGISRAEYVSVTDENDEWVINVRLRKAVDTKKKKIDTFLQEFMNKDWIDPYSIECNDMWQVYHIFGIEAAAHVIQEQIKNVISFGKTYVDDRHYQQLVGCMCYKGIPTGASRHGMSLSDSGPLTMASFEETMKIFTNAAFIGQPDNLTNTAALILVDGKIRTGSAITRYDRKSVGEMPDVIEVDW